VSVGPDVRPDDRDPAAAAPSPVDDYDRFVDWDKRLAREAPFFSHLFEERGVSSAIDVGCGTGRHAVMFSSWGVDVVGVDPDERMLAQARAHAAASGREVRFAEGGFGGLVGLGLGPVDAVTCTGNALPHVAGVQGLRIALADFAAVLRPGGVLVLHLLNHDRLIDARVRSIPPVVREDSEGTSVFLRVMDYVEDGIRFDFVTMRRPAGGWEEDAPWEVSSRRSLHAALPTPLLGRELVAGGFGEVRLFGDHTGRRFESESDESVLMTATRL
jgi:glycine/sarcosine N-methyltransferase